MMLSLDDPRWGELHHAYGDASDTPLLLKMLEAAPNGQKFPDGQKFDESGAEPWRSLNMSICHQGTTCSASYAAVPHIVRIAFLATDPPDLNYFLLPAMIERGRLWPRSEPVPADLAESYFASIKRLPELIPRLAKVAWDEEVALAIIGALLSLCGQPEMGEGFELMRLNDVRLYLKFREELKHIADVKTWKSWDEFGDEDAPAAENRNL